MSETTQYIGARYVPKFYQNSYGNSDWIGGVSYEPLTIVTRNGNSYTSKIPVPAGIGAPENNPDYWVNTGNYNSQYGDIERQINNVVTGYKNADNAIKSEFNGKIENEKNERVNSDEALSSRIDGFDSLVENERTARVNSVNNLQTQIDEIISPTGEAPNPEEIVNARIGINNTVYNTLGEAIRTQVSNLNNNINNIGINQNVGFLTNAHEGYGLNNNAEYSNGNLSYSDYIEIPTNAESVTVRTRVIDADGEHTISPSVYVYDENYSVLYSFGIASNIEDVRTWRLNFPNRKYIRVVQPSARNIAVHPEIPKFVRFNMYNSDEKISAILPYADITWLNGAYVNASGAYIDNDGYATRSAVSSFIGVNKNDIVDTIDFVTSYEGHVVTGFMHLYSNGVWNSRISFSAQSKTIIPENIDSVRFVINVSDITMTDAVINSCFKVKMYRHSCSIDQYDYIKKSMEWCKVNDIRSIGWENGYIENDGTIHTISPSNLFICTPQFMFAKAGTKISVNDNYRKNVIMYSEPNVESFIGRGTLSNKTYMIAQDCFVRLVMAKPETSAIDDVDDCVSKLIIEPSLYALNPFLYIKTPHDESDFNALNRFISEINIKAQKLGMTNSIFTDTLGNETTVSKTTTRDLVRLGIAACSYNPIAEVWSKDQYTVTTLDEQHRTLVCDYGDNPTLLENAYPILGKKAGYIAPVDIRTFSMIAVCLVNDKTVVGAISFDTSREVTADEGRAMRIPAMKELMDNVKAVMEGNTPTTPTIYTRGCAAILPACGSTLMYNSNKVQFIYEYNADTKFAPASTVKVLTAITALDYLDDVHFPMTVMESELSSNADFMVAGDEVNMLQALYIMLLQSNGTMTRTVGRMIGQKIAIAYDKTKVLI